MNKKFTFNFTNGDSISCSLDEWTDDDRDYYRSDESKFLYRLRAALYSNEPMSIGNDSHKVRSKSEFFLCYIGTGKDQPNNNILGRSYRAAFFIAQISR